MEYASPERDGMASGFTMEGHERNRDGEITKTTVMKYIRSRENDEYVLVSAFVDDTDITEKEQRKAEKGNNRNERDYPHPVFDPEKAGGLTQRDSGIIAVIEGRKCLVYDFTLEDEWSMGPGGPKEVVEFGRVFLDAETAMPMRLESTLIEGPNAIKSMSYRMTAGPGPDGLWRLDSVTMEFVGQLIIYRAGDFTMRFEYAES